MTITRGHRPHGRHEAIHHHWLFRTVAALMVLVVVGAMAWVLVARSDRGDADSGASPQGSQPTTTSATSSATPATTPFAFPGGSGVTPSSTIEVILGTRTADLLEAVLVTGRFRGAATGLPLRVQVRGRSGGWLTFPLPAVVDETDEFRTYVELGRPGVHQLRVIDPESGATSPTVTLEVREDRH